MVIKNLFTLILAGGKSERMGKDKSLIEYFGKPQILHLINLISPYTEQLLISRNKNQAPIPYENCEIIFDDESSENQGPLTGLVSAIEKYPSANFLILYCDLVNIDEGLISKLMAERDSGKFATCFMYDGFPEPSICIIENKSNPILLDKYKSGRYSIIKFLKEFDCKKIPLSSKEKIIDKDS